MRPCRGICYLALFFVAGYLAAQAAPSSFQFSFSNPGARSLGLGGAFVALADDATATFANPAGLVQITRPEISIEGRYWSYSTPNTVGGRVWGQPTGIGLDTPIRIEDSEYDTQALSFVSLVYPRRSWTVALSRHQQAKYVVATESQGLFADEFQDDSFVSCLSEPEVCRYPDIRRHTQTDFVATSLSLAYRLSDTFSLGIGASYIEGELRHRGEGYELSEESLPGGLFGPNTYPPLGLLVTQSFELRDADWGFNIGLLWMITGQVSLGGVYRSGPAFKMVGKEVSGPALDPPIPTGSVLESGTDIPIAFPDVYGMGVGYRSKNDFWTVSLEWSHVEYSTILTSIPRSDFIDTREVSIDDADELRLGVEYVFLGTSPNVAVRGGVWHDPDHLIRSHEDDPLERVLLPGGQDEVHFSLGLGIGFENFQTDIAVDYSDIVVTVAASLVYSF